jgi:hypothetical protein
MITKFGLRNPKLVVPTQNGGCFTESEFDGYAFYWLPCMGF